MIKMKKRPPLKEEEEEEGTRREHCMLRLFLIKIHRD